MSKDLDRIRSWAWLSKEVGELVLKTRAEALEEAAKIADKISDECAVGYYGQDVDTADEIAAAIRERAKP